ncbi:MAG: tetratricopeptide repeat protein, partial [Rhodospirillaceae bacterium]
MSRVSRRQQKSRNADPARALEQAQAAMASRDWDGAKKAYRKLLRLRPDLAEAWSDLGTIHLLMGEAGPAEDALERARRLDPLSVVTLSNLANLKKQSGEPDAAEKLYRRILEIVPERANAWHELARVKNFAVGDADIAAMDRLLGAGELDDEGRMHVSFALGKAREDVGNYDAAFRHLAEANRIKHDSLGYDIRHHEKIVQELIRTFEPGFMMAHSSVGCDDETSVFVLGMPRSGTTLVEQILASHSAV